MSRPTQNRTTAYNYALNLLAARPYATRALQRKLVQREYSPSEVNDTIERLLENGLLDDARYAEQYARSKILSSGASKRRLQQDLYRKGIKGDVATRAIASVIEQEEVNPAEVIERVARKKLAQLGDLEPMVLRRRLFAFLARRGYDVDQIKLVVGRLT
jgi:regulatory protein